MKLISRLVAFFQLLRFLHTHIHTHMQKNTQPHISARTHAPTHAHRHTHHTHIHTYTYRHKHTHTQTHTHTHRHTNTHTLSLRRANIRAGKAVMGKTDQIAAVVLAFCHEDHSCLSSCATRGAERSRRRY